MKTNHRSNALLVELLIVVMFFMLASTVLIQLFGAARNQSARAGLIARVTEEAQNVADRLYVAADPEEVLAALGFSGTDELWTKEDADSRTEVLLGEEEEEQGVLRRQEVRVLAADGEVLISLPSARYLEVTP